MRDPRPTRRAFLVSVAAFAAACRGAGETPGGRRDPPVADTGTTGLPLPTTTDPGTSWPGVPGPEPPAAWDPPGELDVVTFACGTQTGDATATAVLVGVRQRVEPTLTLVLARGLVDGWEEVLRIEGLAPDDGVLQVELVDLVPDTTYSVVAYAPDGVRRGPAARFRTALYPGSSRIVRFGATSCLGSPGQPWPCLSRVAAQKLDFFVLLGDTIYADEGLRPAGDWEGHWDDALAVEGLRALTASTSVVATWDDHEVDNDWRWTDAGMPDTALAAYDAFKRGIPSREGPGGSRIWRQLAWGDAVELFVLDCRGERLDGNYLSPEQMAWLEQGLLASAARFKIVVNSVPITDMDDVYFGIAADDRWDGHPEQRSRILDWIRDQGITGVLWIAGDFHWGAVSTIGRPGEPHDDRHEVFCGPAGSLVNPVALIAPEAQFPVVVDAYNAVVFEADPDAGTVRIVFEGDSGVLAEHTLAP